jgi:hypothetical protein
MKRLSVNQLEEIFSLPLSIDLARGTRMMSDAQAEDRLAVALHESAHLTASIACPNTSILGVSVYAPYRAKHLQGRGIDGQVRSCSLEPEHDAFINFVGVAWEERHGDVNYAAADYRAGVAHARASVSDRPGSAGEIKRILDCARVFVLEADTAIRWASVGLLALVPNSGDLNRRKTAKLAEILRPHVPSYAEIVGRQG